MSDGELVPGVHTKREPLGSYSIVDGGWPAEICTSLAIANQFGAIRFEVEIAGNVNRTLQQARQRHFGGHSSLSMQEMLKELKQETDEDDARITFYAVRIDG